MGERCSDCNWTVRFEWEFTSQKKPVTLKSRRDDVKVGQRWYIFDKHAVNSNGREWLDVFDGEGGGFHCG